MTGAGWARALSLLERVDCVLGVGDSPGRLSPGERDQIGDLSKFGGVKTLFIYF